MAIKEADVTALRFASLGLALVAALGAVTPASAETTGLFNSQY